MVALMSDRLIRYRVLDAVPAEGRVERGFHRLGLAISVPLLVLGIIGCFGAKLAGHPGDLFVPAMLGILGAALYTASRTLGWIASGFANR